MEIAVFLNDIIGKKRQGRMKDSGKMALIMEHVRSRNGVCDEEMVKDFMEEFRAKMRKSYSLFAVFEQKFEVWSKQEFCTIRKSRAEEKSGPSVAIPPIIAVSPDKIPPLATASPPTFMPPIIVPATKAGPSRSSQPPIAGSRSIGVQKGPPICLGTILPKCSLLSDTEEDTDTE